MWRRRSGLAAIAALIMSLWMYLVPGTDLASENFAQIAAKQRSMDHQLDLLDQELHPAGGVVSAGAGLDQSAPTPLDRRGPNLLDGFIPTGRARL